MSVRRKTGLTLLSAIALTLLIVGAGDMAFAQRVGGTLRGVIKDATGAVVPGATVSAVNENTGAKFDTVSSSAGLYSFPNLLVGNYTVTVELPGFKKFVRKNIPVSANQVTDADATLEVGEVSTTVEVVGGAELISTTSSQLGETIGTKAVNDLPNPVLGGSPLNLAISLPNTTTQGGGVLGEGGSIGGNRPRDNNFTIDGVDNNDVSVTGPLQPVIQDAVAEFNLITNQFSAEYGHSTAGQFNIVTKSGTNEFHGSAFYYGQNRNLNALDNLTKASILNGTIPDKPRYDFNRVGGTFGGPIIKDKLLFFGAYEYSTEGLASTGVAVDAPTAEGLSTLKNMAANSSVADILNQFPTAPVATNSETVNGVSIPVGTLNTFAPDFYNRNDFQTNADLNLGKHQIRGRFLYDRYRAPNLNPQLPQTQFTGALADDNRKLALTDVWTVTSRLVNDFRTSYSRFVQDYQIPGAFANFPNVEIDTLGLNIGPEGNSPQSTIQNIYQVLDNVSYSYGRHELKGGIEYRNWIAPQNFLPRSRGEWDYADLGQFINDLVPNGSNSALRGAGSGFFAGNQQAVYWFMQDDMKATKNLTLNLGIRYEFTTNPRDASLQTLNSIASLPGVFDFRKPTTDKDDWGPRVGLAYAPDFSNSILKKVFGESGKSSIRAGFGMAYDVNFQNLVVLQLPPQLQTEQNPNLTCAAAAPPAWCASGAGFLAGGGLLQVNVPPVTQADARSATQSLIVDQTSPKTYTWTLSVEREVGSNWSVELRYLGTRGLDLPVQARLNSISVFETNPNLVVPTYFTNSAVPANVAASAPSLRDFLDAETLRYIDQGFDGGFVTAFEPLGQSTYHAGSVNVTRRMAKGMYILGNYTFSKTMDNSTNELFSSLVNPRRPEDPFDMANERGLSVLDMPQKFSLSWLYEFPKVKLNNSFAKGFLDGWQFNGTYLAESGQPITALSGHDSNGNLDSAGDRAIINPDGSGLTGSGVDFVLRNPVTGATSIVTSIPSNGSLNSQVVGYVAQNPSARFIVAMPGTPLSAQVGRDTIRTPGLNNWNLSMFKDIHLTEGKYFQFRVELYNAFNHRQYSLGLPTYQQLNTNALSSTYANVSSLQFLDATQFSGGNRSMQLSLKFNF